MAICLVVGRSVFSGEGTASKTKNSVKEASTWRGCYFAKRNYERWGRESNTRTFRVGFTMVQGGKKSLSVAILNEFYTFDLMEILYAKLNFKVKFFFLFTLYPTHQIEKWQESFLIT